MKRSHFHTRNLICVLTALVAAGCSAPPPAPGEPAPREVSVPTAVTWTIAGEYAAGRLGGWRSFSLKPDGTWSSESGGCTGLTSAHRGRWQEIEGRALLRVQESLKSGFGWNEEQAWARDDGVIPFAVMHWGPRIYLMRDEGWLEFVNKVNQGLEPREQADGWFLLREGDEKLFVTGPPPVPEEWRSWLLSAPIRGELLEALDDGTGVATLGARQGVRKGMTLTVCTPKGWNFIQTEVVGVEEDRCIVKRMYGHEESPFVAGMTVRSTFFEPEER